MLKNMATPCTDSKSPNDLAVRVMGWGGREDSGILGYCMLKKHTVLHGYKSTALLV